MKKIFSFLLTAILLGAFASCSKDDEPSGYEPTYDGVSIYINALQTLYDKDARPPFTPSGRPGVYVAAASSYDASYSFISELLENPDWDGKNVTVELGEKGEQGTLKIIGKTDALLQNGIYNQIIVDIKDYTPYTLEIVTTAQGENGYGHDIVVIK